MTLNDTFIEIMGNNHKISQQFIDIMDRDATPLIQLAYGIPPLPPPVPANPQLLIPLVSSLGSPPSAIAPATAFLSALSVDISLILALLTAGAVSITSIGIGITSAAPISPATTLPFVIFNPLIATSLLKWASSLIIDGDLRLTGPGGFLKPQVI